MASSELLAAIRAVDDQISVIHIAFGAPGDYGYETSKGKALHGLLKSQAVLRTAIGGEPHRQRWQVEFLSLLRRWEALDAGAWNIERHAADKAQLLADTRLAVALAASYDPTTQPFDEPIRHED